MTMYDTIDDDTEPDTDALRSGLRTRADLVTVSVPPIPAVRQRARQRRTRRRMVQALSGIAAASAVVGGALVWAPGRDGGDGAPTTTPWPTPSPSPSLSPSLATSTADYLRATDLGAGWTGPVGATPSPQLDMGGACEQEGVFHPQIPVAPAVDYLYTSSPPGKPAIEMFEAVYTFAPGTGRAVMNRVNTALGVFCEQPEAVRTLDTPTVADDSIGYTTGGNNCYILVRSGDRVASAVVPVMPGGAEETGWIDLVTAQMGKRLTGG
ncbi:hypothetical protein KGQ20_26460 [Catenulispora sp. NF23]|uniref:hypothetical protein n=1 Tax=Catenulispora pinistramenti TaxID=2705254 RepID=UPI001BA5D843|nr:hypothetical protein [Catenulispora pinistramenti]MBS2536313.1 hypothetical protein [Catenulispora pinistramenti]